jgi:hypothetical protein
VGIGNSGVFEMGFGLSAPGSGWSLVGHPFKPQDIGGKIQ